MSSIQSILEQKGREVHTVAPNDMVLEALKLMAEKDIGSVVVMSGKSLVGLFTERHYTRKVFLKGRASPTTAVREVMETDIYTVEPDQSLEACLALMTDKRIRHLPVMSRGRLVGIISIGDLLKSMIEERKFNIEQLVKYVQG